MKKFLIWVLFSVLFALGIYAVSAFIVWDFYSIADLNESTRFFMLYTWVCFSTISGLWIVERVR